MTKLKSKTSEHIILIRILVGSVHKNILSKNMQNKIDFWEVAFDRFDKVHPLRAQFYSFHLLILSSCHAHRK